MLNRNKIVVILCFLLLLLSVYIKEILSLEINSLIAGGNKFSKVGVLKELSTNELVKWKWLVSIFFTIVISILTLLSFHFWFKNITYTKMVAKLYLIVLCLVIFIGGAGFLTIGFSEVYPLLRRVFGIIHSPIPFFILFVLFYWKEKEEL
ncbi:MAG: hypothetical protein COB15_04020 [Flavobacteriales bacterium]|nr:MAG: hypothetical protein COB15_04020 [Flavobacteriales bacterium]